MLIKDNLRSVVIQSQMGQIEESASIEVEDASLPYLIDQDVELAIAGGERAYYVSESKKQLSHGGWVQGLGCVSKVAKLAKKTPLKPQKFISLTQTEYDLWQASQDVQAFSEFTPLVRPRGLDDTGGWTLHSIVETLGNMAGMTVHCNIPDYPISQFTVSPSQSFYEAIRSLVNFIEPHTYSVGGHIFISLPENEAMDWGPDNLLPAQTARAVSEEVVRKDKPTQIRLIGDVGTFRRDRYKGSMFTTRLPYSLLIGNISVQLLAYGITTETDSFESGNPTGNYDTDTGIDGGYSLESVVKTYGLDAFGNKAYEVGEVRSTYRYHKTQGLVLYRRESKATWFDDTHFLFLNPKETKREEVVDQMVWQSVSGSPQFQLYSNLEKKTTTYNDNAGVLTGQATYVEGTVYTEDDAEFLPLAMLGKDDVSDSGKLLKRIVRSEVTSYTQISPDAYGVRRVSSRLGADGKYETESDLQVVQAGAVQGVRGGMRTMEAYAETGAPRFGNVEDMTAIMTTPAREIRVNTSSWEALERLLPFFARKLTKDEILRTYEVSGELDVRLGLQVNLGAETHYAGPQLPVPSLDPGYRPTIVAYNIRGDAHRAVTSFTVRGRLN